MNLMNLKHRAILTGATGGTIIPPTPPIPQYDGLKFTATTSDTAISYSVTGSPTGSTLYYKRPTDADWTVWTANTEVILQTDDVIFVKGDNSSGLSSGTSDYVNFNIAKPVRASGNVNSLLDNDDGSTVSTLQRYCYYSLFRNCKITTAPELPVTNMRNASSWCYSRMFMNCDLLVEMPELPATDLSLPQNCYEFMFYGCTSLSVVHPLPATRVGLYNYQYMFEGCTSLTTAPEIYATDFGSNYGCFNDMFENCSNLNYIKIHYVGNFELGNFNGWVYGVSATGDFYYDGADTTESISAIPVGWTVHGYDGLRFKATQNNSKIKYKITGTLDTLNLKYSYDSRTWTDWSPNTDIPLNNGKFIFVKGNNPSGPSKSAYNYVTFDMSGKIAASGNINSMIDDGDGSTINKINQPYAFKSLFYDCSSLTSAPRLPATTLNNQCYADMFVRCTSLTTAPDLPATTTTLPYMCYRRMFYDCHLLNYVKIYYTGSFSTNSCFDLWLSGVAATGDIYYNGNDSTVSDSAIPSGWTKHPF